MDHPTRAGDLAWWGLLASRVQGPVLHLQHGGQKETMKTCGHAKSQAEMVTPLPPDPKAGLSPGIPHWEKDKAEADGSQRGTGERFHTVLTAHQTSWGERLEPRQP